MKRKKNARSRIGDCYISTHDCDVRWEISCLGPCMPSISLVGRSVGRSIKKKWTTFCRHSRSCWPNRIITLILHYGRKHALWTVNVCSWKGKYYLLNKVIAPRMYVICLTNVLACFPPAGAHRLNAETTIYFYSIRKQSLDKIYNHVIQIGLRRLMHSIVHPLRTNIKVFRQRQLCNVISRQSQSVPGGRSLGMFPV